jgi:hypothetical protein
MATPANAWPMRLATALFMWWFMVISPAGGY